MRGEWREVLAVWAPTPTDPPLPTPIPSPSHTISGLASNQWYETDPSAIWTAWWHRWAIGSGAYFLYPYESSPGAALAVNHKEPGDHFTKTPDPGADLGLAGGGRRWQAATPPPPPPLSSLPLYDLHLRPVRGWRGTLAQREGVLAGHGGECTWLGKGKKKGTGKGGQGEGGRAAGGGAEKGEGGRAALGEGGKGKGWRA